MRGEDNYHSKCIRRLAKVPREVFTEGCSICLVAIGRPCYVSVTEEAFSAPPHEPSARCVDTCNNPLECKEEWNRYQTRMSKEVEHGEP